MGKVPTESNSFLNFERILYWYEIKAYFFKNLFLSYFFNSYFFACELGNRDPILTWPKKNLYHPQNIGKRRFRLGTRIPGSKVFGFMLEKISKISTSPLSFAILLGKCGRTANPRVFGVNAPQSLAPSRSSQVFIFAHCILMMPIYGVPIVTSLRFFSTN